MIRDVTLGQGFEDVFAQYGAILSRVANSYEANEAMQQELLQEIAIAVWQGLSRFKGDSSVKTYILKIAHNRAVTHVANQVKRLDTHQYDHDDLGSDGLPRLQAAACSRRAGGAREAARPVRKAPQASQSLGIH